MTAVKSSRTANPLHSLIAKKPMLYFTGGGDLVAAPVYQFGDFQLDCGRFELLRDGRTIRVERKPMELLILLVSREGQLVTRAEIAQRMWDSEVFVDTEHGINTAIRKIRQVLRDDPANPRFVQTVTGMGYRFIAPVSGIQLGVEDSRPSAAPLVPEALEPEPLSSTIPASMPDPASKEAPAPPSPVKIRLRPWLALAVLAVFVIATLTVTLGPHRLAARLLHRNTPRGITSLAVIPLDNLSGDPGQEYFADGMTDELITMLAKNSNLRITSRTSVMQYKGVHKPLPEIAQGLGVDGILEGSISRANGQVHMTLQLIRADTDTHLWAESYDRSNNDVAALPEEAARDIAGRLHSSVASITPARYVNPEAHDAYQQGRYLWFAGDIDAALPYFKKATELQPDYALAWAGLSGYYGAGVMFGDLDPRKVLPLVDLTSAKCLQLDPSESQCHLSMAGDDLVSKWKFDEALQETSRSIELDQKNSEAYEVRARILQALNRQEESVRAEKTSNELNPANPWGLMLALWIARRYDDALRDAQQRVVATPRDPVMQLFLGAIYRGKGMDKESMQCIEKFYRYSGQPEAADSLHRAFESGGVKAAVEWQIRFDKASAAKHYVGPVDVAELYAQLGDREQTLARLEEAFRQHSPPLLWIQSDAAYDFLHADPRYRSLIQRIGLPPAY
jgi:TolB-like protein/DNA-binding winged helix-turn-helix (wHTH) protein